MPARRITTVRIDEELLRGLQKVWERDGITSGEQINRAIRKWLDEKGVQVKADRKRAGTRKRP